MQDVSQKLNKDTITIEEYDKYGIYNSSTLRRRFGNWAICLQKANLRSSKINYSNVTRKDILQFLQRYQACRYKYSYHKSIYKTETKRRFFK